MKGPQLETIRETLGISAAEFANALGYAGSSRARTIQVRRLEKGERPIPLPIGRLAVMFSRHGIPPDWLQMIDE